MTKFAISALNRRQFLSTTAAATLMAGVSIPKFAFGADKVVKIGFLAPLTGEVAAWGKPGLDGCRIWADWVNADGGIKIGDDAYKVEFVAYDDEYDPGKARTGAVKLIKEDGVQFIMMLGGDPWPGVSPVSDKEKMLFSTLLPSDLTPDTKFLVAPCEVHPIYNVTGVEWLAENKPDLKTAVICAQDDSLGKPSVATYLAAFEAAGIKVIGDPIFFDPATTDFAPIMSKMLALKPDIIFYPKMVEKTSKEFMEGFIFQFPDFDDPALNEPQINFNKPNEFFEEYKKRFGEDEWSAVSWEYASIMDLWSDAAGRAGTTEPEKVLEAMKVGGTGKQAFGEAEWWGKELFGIDNALVGFWPVVVIEDGKARIKEYKSIPAWWAKHKDLMIKHMEALGQMYYQRT
jgi:branched-chain amino acid transport system substrate-binding protein